MLRTEISAEMVHGAVELERTAQGLLPHRLTSASRAQLGGPVEPKVFSDPSGVRLRLHTEATDLQLIVWPQREAPEAHGAEGVPSVYDIWCDNTLVAQQEVELGEDGRGVVVVPRLPAGAKTVEIWLPYQEWTVLGAVLSEAPVQPAPVDTGAVQWVHYGSSISHGYDAVGSSHAWPAVAARGATHQGVDVALTNLGFAGNAKLDPFAARTIRQLPADVISLKIGINVVNGDSHTLRAFTPALHGFLDTLREGRHEQTPIVVISPLWCGIHETTPGPVESYEQPDDSGRLRKYFRATGDPQDPNRPTLEQIRAEVERVVRLRAQTDPRLLFLDGLELYGAQDAQRLPLPDLLHPSHEAHQLIGSRFAAELVRIFRAELASGRPAGQTRDARPSVPR